MNLKDQRTNWKYILIVVILTFLGITVLAQEAELPSPGLTPDSPFYFLDTLAEKIGMFFTLGAEKKAEKAVRYAEEKLAELKAMAEKNKIQALERANQKYQEFLRLANMKTQEAKEKGKDVEELAVLITEKTLKHQEVLIEIFEKVPEEAKEGIQKAIEVSRSGSEEAVQAVTGVKKEELLQKIEEVKIKAEERIKLEQLLAETADWNIYNNHIFGYKIKYPDDIFAIIPTSFSDNKNTLFEIVPQAAVTIQIGQNPERLSVIDWIEQTPDDISFFIRKYKDTIETININEKECARVISVTQSQGRPMEQWVHTVIPFETRMVVISKVEEDKSYNLEQVYQKMLPTFEFVELEEAEEAPKVEEKPYIKVISPNGGEEWKVGSTYNITWASEDVEKVNIFLLGCKTKECPVESGISSYKIYPHSLDAEAGKHSWTIYSKDIGFGFGFGISEYVCFKIKIEEASSESVGILDNFLSMLAYIANKLGIQTSDLVKDVSDECFRIIEVALPEEEKEKEEACPLPETPVLTGPGISVNNNEPYTLNWTSVEGATGYWYQSGYGAPVFDAPAVYTNLNSITHTQHLGTSVTFYYRVKACNDCGCSVWSNIVDIQVIVAPFIRITSPNGGERWVVGQTYNIEWQSYRLEKVTIDLFAYNAEGQVIKGFQYFIAESIDATRGYYNWTIPEIADYPNYKLRIYNKLCIGGDADLLAECLKDRYFDESDGYFSIVE
ncbi:MAG: DUF5667 domain-containing protein [Candidatus Nealsonbacteria bacterium]